MFILQNIMNITINIATLCISVRIMISVHINCYYEWFDSIVILFILFGILYECVYHMYIYMYKRMHSWVNISLLLLRLCML